MLPFTSQQEPRSRPSTALRLLYNLMYTWGLVATLPVSLPLALNSPKRRATLLQRFGVPGFKRFASHGDRAGLRPVWVHALSVGEVFSAIPLVRQWRHTFSSEPLVFSASTHTGYAIAQSEVAPTVDALFYFPYDFIFTVRRTAQQVNPRAVVLVETDIWPNFLFEMQRRDVPVILVNAKLSERSMRGYQRLGQLIRPVFSSLALVCAQTDQDAEHFKKLGVRPGCVHITGNLKFDQPPPPAETLDDLRLELNLLSGEHVVVAGSTHPGEEVLLNAAWQSIRRHGMQGKLVVAPRDPARATEVRRIFRRNGYDATLLKDVQQSDVKPFYEVLVIDRVGLLNRLYGLADVAVVGGSLAPFGGHNPLEPAAWSKPIIFGADMRDFSQVARRLIAGQGAIQVRDQADLAAALIALFSDKRHAATVGRNAHRVFKQNQGAMSRTIGVIKDFRQPGKP